MTFWQRTSLHGDVVEMTSLETRALTLDTAPYAPAGATPSQPSTKLVDLTTGRAVPLASGPVLRPGETVITQLVRGLEAGHTYELVWAWQAGPARPSRITTIRVPI